MNRSLLLALSLLFVLPACDREGKSEVEPTRALAPESSAVVSDPRLAPPRPAETPCGKDTKCPSYAKCFCDSQGREVRRNTDFDGKEPRDTVRYEYDDRGRLVRVVDDVSSNGKPDAIVTYEYDDAGRLVRQETEELISGGNTTVTRFVYNASGHFAGTDSGLETIIGLRCTYSPPCPILPDPRNPTYLPDSCKSSKRNCDRVNIPW